MGRFLDSAFAAPQDPLFGVHRANITTRLTARNWKKKAVVRITQDCPLYVWIAKSTCQDEAGVRKAIYSINVKVLESGAQARKYEREFDTLEAALGYGNAEDGGKLALESVSATPDLYPPDQEAPWTISFGPRASQPPPESGHAAPDSIKARDSVFRHVEERAKLANEARARNKQILRDHAARNVSTSDQGEETPRPTKKKRAATRRAD
jgi:hypothetical protein